MQPNHGSADSHLFSNSAKAAPVHDADKHRHTFQFIHYYQAWLVKDKNITLFIKFHQRVLICFHLVQEG